MNIKLRYKQPDGNTSSLIEHAVTDVTTGFEQTSDNFRFAAAVAEFGMLLRHSRYKGEGDYALVQKLAEGATGKDIEGYRKEFTRLVKTASLLADQAKIKQVKIIPVNK
jgi:Ca-activated chloride channel family protein